MHAILVTSLLQFQLEGFAPQILVSKMASRLNNIMEGQAATFSRIDASTDADMDPGSSFLQPSWLKAFPHKTRFLELPND